MSRIASGDTVIRKPENNVYTAIVVCAVVVQIIGVVLLFMRYSELFEHTLFGSPK
jgi:hypothetical protein